MPTRSGKDGLVNTFHNGNRDRSDLRNLKEGELICLVDDSVKRSKQKLKLGRII